MAFTANNDINILQSSDAAVVGAGAGNDTYVLSPSTLSANQEVTISDTQGSNKLQLIDGLTIASSTVASNAVLLTLSNGAKVKVLGADTFSYEVGGSPLTGTAGTVQTYAQFVTTTLGAASVPTTGTVSGSANVTIPGGSTGGGAGQAFSLTASADSVNEDGSVTYTVTASKAVTEATNVVFTLVPGSTTAADQGTATTNLNDFGQGAFNPVTVTIPVNGTTAIFTITPPNDDKTELAESFSVQAVVAGTTLTKTATLLDGTSGGGKTYMLTTGVDNVTGTAGNDTINGVADGVAASAVAGNTFGGLDVVNGGAGTDTLVLTNDAGTMTLATSVKVSNVENLSLRSAQNAITADVQAWTGLQAVTVEQLGTKAAIDVDTKSNATSVSVTGGTTVAIDDNGSATTTADTLATVSLNGNTGVATIGSDALNKLTVANSNQNVTVNAAAGTRALDLTVTKLTGGIIADAQATSLKVTATGTATTDNSTGITLTAGNAATIEFAGDKTVSTVLGAQKANLAITSTNTAGVTITTALNNDVTFTGGAGKDTITVGATTKTIDMGAGDDTVEVTAALGTNGKLVGGEGADTLKMTAAVADTLDNNDTFEKAVEGFEKLSLGAVAAETANTVNLANLDDINYVISAGTAGGGTTETNTVTFTDLTAFQSVTVAGITVKAGAGGATADAVARSVSGGTLGAGMTREGSLVGWTAAEVVPGTGQVVYTSTTANTPVDNIVPTVASVPAPTSTLNLTNQAHGNGTTTHESFTINFLPLLAGQSVSIDSRVMRANIDLSAHQVASKFAAQNGADTQVSFSGVYASADAAWNTVVVPGVTNSVNFVATDAIWWNYDPVNLALSGTSAPAQPTVAETAGVTGSSLTVTNMANAGTFELTGVVAGAATVTMKDATGTADSLNIKLNGTANLVNTGTLTVAGVETINIEATDSSADTTTLTNPAAASKPNLVAADATKIVVSGNHGVDFTGSTLTKVVELDASGVVATGATTGATAAQIATAGAVTFTSAVTDKSVTVKTGNGADVINLSSVTDATKGATVTTGEGGDTITGTAGNDTIDAGAGRDTVNATAGADTITLGVGNDVYVLGAATNSTLAKSDVITDFVANTKGRGTTAADIAKGAISTVADLTGDTINVSTALTAAGVATTGISVFVAGNAADAQTFLQNTGNAGTLTGFALDSSSGKLYMDFDSNGTVDSVVTLTGVTTITEAAFVTGIV